MITALMLVLKLTCRSFLQVAKQVWFLPRAWKPDSVATAHANTLKRILNQKVRPVRQPSDLTAKVPLGPANISGLLCVHTLLAAQSAVEVPVIVNVVKP